MKLLMLKLLMITLSASTLFASSLEDKVLEFLKKTTSSTKSYNITNIKIVSTQDMESLAGWKVFFVKVDLDLLDQGRSVSVTDKIFTNGQFVTRDLLDINSAMSIKDNFIPEFKDEFYSDINIIAGKKGAPNKIAIFSDPLCPHCNRLMPEVIDFVKKHPEQFVLYYYHFILNPKSNSTTIVKAGLVAKKQGIKNVDKRIYQERLSVVKADESLILSRVNALLGTNIKLEELNQKSILKQLENDMKVVSALGLNSAPMLFINGKIDPTKEAFKELLKK